MSNAFTLSLLGLYGLFSRRLFFIFLCGAAAVFSAIFLSGIVIGETDQSGGGPGAQVHRRNRIVRGYRNWC